MNVRMYRMMMGVIVGSMVVFAFPPHEAYSQKIVHSSGVSVILQDNIQMARTRAIDKAFHQALQESIAGIFHFSNLTNFNETVQRLLSEDPLYYIERYRFLADVQDENLYKVDLEVWVSEEKIKNRLEEYGMIRKSSKVFQLGILISTKTERQSPRDFFQGENPDFTNFVSQQARTRGFYVINGSISVDDSPRSFEKLRVNNQLTAMQGRRLGADAVVLGQVEIRSEASRFGMELPGDYSVALWARAIRSLDGNLLGLRESNFTMKQNISKFMLRQMIQQNLDAVLAALGEDIQRNME